MGNLSDIGCLFKNAVQVGQRDASDLRIIEKTNVFNDLPVAQFRVLSGCHISPRYPYLKEQFYRMQRQLNKFAGKQKVTNFYG